MYRQGSLHRHFTTTCLFICCTLCIMCEKHKFTCVLCLIPHTSNLPHNATVIYTCDSHPFSTYCEPDMVCHYVCSLFVS